MNDNPSIKAVNLTKVFGKRVGVNQLNLSVYPGELYTLLGDNGAGKTTTVNMLTTLIKPSDGQFFICGFDGLKDAEKAKRTFAVVSQDVSLYRELTAYENLIFIARLNGIPEKRAEAKIEELLRQSGLIDRKDDIVGDFSGGMERKLAIASALLREPDVLFMDEPTVGLDPSSRHHIWEILRDLKSQGKTIFLTTHYIEEAELLSDRVGIIVLGRLVIEGTIDELRTTLHGMRSIQIRLTNNLGHEEIKSRLEGFRQIFEGEVSFDPLRNSISLVPPQSAAFSHTLKMVLDWLDKEQITYMGVASSEPSLEELFLTASQRAASKDGLTLSGEKARN